MRFGCFLLVVCCALFVGCKEEEKVSEHQHSASCSHSPKPSVHQHSAACSHSKETVSSKGKQRVSFYERTEEQMTPIAREAEAGDLTASFAMYRYYSRNKNQEKAEAWLNKTCQIAEAAPADDLRAKKLLQKLNKLAAAKVPAAGGDKKVVL